MRTLSVVVAYWCVEFLFSRITTLLVFVSESSRIQNCLPFNLLHRFILKLLEIEIKLIVLALVWLQSLVRIGVCLPFTGCKRGIARPYWLFSRVAFQRLNIGLRPFIWVSEISMNRIVFMLKRFLFFSEERLLLGISLFLALRYDMQGLNFDWWNIW